MIEWEEQKIELARDLTPRLYSGQYLQSIFNAWEERHQNGGWILKNKDWSPYFLNMRPIGNSPDLLADVAFAMALLHENEMPDVNKVVGVEMAGIPIATATSMINHERRGFSLPFCYTRPLDRYPTEEELKKALETGDTLDLKIRKPKQAIETLETMKRKGELKRYGQKNLVEGRLVDGDVFAIWDDMATDSASKLIARLILQYEAERLGVDIECVDAGYSLDRGAGAVKAGIEYAEKGKEIGDPNPQSMFMHFIIDLTSVGLPTLESVMAPHEFALIRSYQEDKERYQDKGVQEYVLKERRAPSEFL